MCSRVLLRQQRAKPLIRTKTVENLQLESGLRRGKEGAIEKRIARKWHIITLQEAIEYVDHGLLTNRFHVNTFFFVVKVKSTYLHDTRLA